MPHHHAMTCMLLLVAGCGSTSTVPDASGCVVELGCPDAVEPPRCATDPAEVLSVDALHRDRAAFDGEVVTVRGYLTAMDRVCTELGCPGLACCNRCDGRLALDAELEPMRGRARPSMIRLGDVREALWRCVGDETRVCCAHPLRERAVLVTGVFTASTGRIPLLLEAEHAHIAPESICIP